jgi:hypothetical protein
MDLGVFYEVVVPLLEMEKAVLIMISTPVDSFNFFSALIDLKDKDTGENIFLVYHAELICERCKKTDHPENCQHRRHLIPPWKSVEKQDIVKMILKDNITTLKRESMGVISDEGTSIVDTRDIKSFKEAPLYVFDARDYPKWIMIMCDPNTTGGALSSEMALTAIAFIRGQYVVKYFLFLFIKRETIKNSSIVVVVIIIELIMYVSQFTVEIVFFGLHFNDVARF